MLEKACLTVETAAKGGGVYPEVLFDVARQWLSLYQKVCHFLTEISSCGLLMLILFYSICHLMLTSSMMIVTIMIH
jgi:hypothetical protein